MALAGFDYGRPCGPPFAQLTTARAKLKLQKKSYTTVVSAYYRMEYADSGELVDVITTPALPSGIEKADGRNTKHLAIPISIKGGQSFHFKYLLEPIPAEIEEQRRQLGGIFRGPIEHSIRSRLTRLDGRSVIADVSFQSPDHPGVPSKDDRLPGLLYSKMMSMRDLGVADRYIAHGFDGMLQLKVSHGGYYIRGVAFVGETGADGEWKFTTLLPRHVVVSD